MKAAYTGWTWITQRDPEAAKNLLKQSFQECKFLGYDTVENFAFIRDYYADNPQELVDLAKECGVELVNLYGHFTFDVEEAIRIAKEQIDFVAAIGANFGRREVGEDMTLLYELTERFMREFEQTFGSVKCAELMEGKDPALMEQQHKCADIVAGAVDIAARIIEEGRAAAKK